MIGSRLRRLVEQANRPGIVPNGPGEAPSDVCDLCAEAVGSDHRHLLDLEDGQPLCVCRACSILFDRGQGGGDRYRLIPDRARPADDLRLTDEQWASLEIPVDVAYVVRRSRDERIAVMYPGAMGAVEAALDPGPWESLLEQDPVLRSLEPEVEALLVNRRREAWEQWIVPIDVCFRLVGIIRMRWRGLSGGDEVWEEIERFFDELRTQGSTSGDELPR